MQKKISIEGMTCSNCVNYVKEALEDLNVKVLEVNLNKKYALVDTNIENKAIVEAILEIGYNVISII